MNILMICNSYPNRQYPNAYVFVHNQTQMLRRRGHNVIVLDVDLRSPRWKRKYGFWLDEYDGVKVYRMSIPFITRNPMPTKVVNWITKKLALKAFQRMLQNEEKFDLMHAHFAFGSGAAAVAIKEKYGIPYVITEHSSGIHTHKQNIVAASMECYCNADKIIAVSEVLKNAIKECGITSQIEVVPNVINTDSFIPTNNKKNDLFVFLTVARLIPSKGIDSLIRAFAHVVQINRNVKLVIVGEGPEEIKLRSLVSNLDMCDKVEFKGKIPNQQMPRIYNESDCFVLPSHNETFGMVYAEAASCGIPIIGTRCGGPEDIICDINGLLIENGNGSALQLAMETVYANCQKGVYDKERIHQDIEERFGEQKVYELLIKEYDEIEK